MQIELGQPLAFRYDDVDEVDGLQQVSQQRLAKHQHDRTTALQLAREAHEQQNIGQALFGIEQDALAVDRAAIPCGLAEVRRRCLGQTLAGLVGGKPGLEFAAHQQRYGKFGAGAAIVGMKCQRATETADRLV